MDESQLSSAEFPPLQHSQSRIPPETGPTIAARPPAINSGFGHPTAYDVFLAEDVDPTSNEDMETDTSPPNPTQPNAPTEGLQDFLKIIGQSTITTDLLLVSFIPDKIKPDTFIQFMDTIVGMLVSDSTKHKSRPPVYKRPGFLDFFTSKPPLWMVLYHAAEQHGSFLLPMKSG